MRLRAKRSFFVLNVCPPGSFFVSGRQRKVAMVARGVGNHHRTYNYDFLAIWRPQWPAMGVVRAASRSVMSRRNGYIGMIFFNESGSGVKCVHEPIPPYFECLRVFSAALKSMYELCITDLRIYNDRAGPTNLLGGCCAEALLATFDDYSNNSITPEAGVGEKSEKS